MWRCGGQSNRTSEIAREQNSSYSRGGLVGNHFRVKYLIFHTYLLEIFFFKDLKNVTRIPEHILDLRYLLKWRRNRKFNENYVFNFLAKF